MITAILRTYQSNDTFTDKVINLPDDYWTRDWFDEKGDIIQYSENMIKPNQSIINPDDLKSEYKKMRWSRAFARPGHVFRIDSLTTGDEK